MHRILGKLPYLALSTPTLETYEIVYYSRVCYPHTYDGFVTEIVEICCI